MSTKTENRKKFRVPATQPWEKIVDQLGNEMERVSCEMAQLSVEMLDVGEIADCEHLTKRGNKLYGAAKKLYRWATDIREVEK